MPRWRHDCAKRATGGPVFLSSVVCTSLLVPKLQLGCEGKYWLKDFGGSVADLSEAIALDKEKASLHWLRARSLFGQGTINLALTDTAESLRLDPKCAPALALRGYLLGCAGEREEAMRCLNQAVSLDPQYAPALFYRGLLHATAERDFAGAAEDMKQCLLANALPEILDPERVYVAYAMTLWHLGTRPWDVALRHAAMARRLNPDSLAAEIAVAGSYVKSGRPWTGLRWADQCIRREPGSILAHHCRLVCLAALGRLEEAAETAEAMIGLRPETAPPLATAARVFSLAGDYRRAIDVCEEAIGCQPASPRGLLEKARVLAGCPDAELRDGEAALRLAQKASELSAGKDHLVVAISAFAYSEMGQFDQALDKLGQAILLTDKKETRQYYEEWLKASETGTPFRLDKSDTHGVNRLDPAEIDFGIAF